MAILKTLGKLVAGTAAVCAAGLSISTFMTNKWAGDMQKGQYKFKHIIPSETSVYCYSNTESVFFDINGAGMKDAPKHISCRSSDNYGSITGILSGKVNVTKDNFLDAPTIIKENATSFYEATVNCDWSKKPPVEVVVLPNISLAFHAGATVENVTLYACEKSLRYKIVMEALDQYIPDCFFKRFFPNLYFKYYIRTHEFKEITDQQIEEIQAKAQKADIDLLKSLGFNVYLDNEKV